jgi:Protein of unknown function (DUF3987)
MYLPYQNNFPVEYLPPLIKNAVLEMHRNTQFPLPLIVSSALGAISLACQNTIDVRLPVGSVSSCSLYMLVVADSGQGKTPVDNYFNQPFRDFEEYETKKLEAGFFLQKAYRKTWELELNEIESHVSKNRKKILAAHNAEQTEQLESEFEILQQKLQEHFLKEPIPQRNFKLLYSNTTPAKMASDLYNNWPSACLSSDEAGSLFRGEAMKDLGMLNQLWDGSPLSIDRISSPSFSVRNARLTVSLMVQPKIMQSYLAKRGQEARDIGFFARFLIAYPISTKGSRFLTDQPQSWNDLKRFRDRISEILIQDKLEVDQGRQTKRILEFSQSAKESWIRFRNKIELDLNAGGYLSDVSDGASKISINLARMAALLHFFEGHEGEISDNTLTQAKFICEWYMHEFKRLFTVAPQIPIEMSDAIELEQSLIRWCQNHPGNTAILKRSVVQYCPNQLRRNEHRRDAALQYLITQNKICIVQDGKKQWVVFNPSYFPVPGDYRSSWNLI